MKIIQPHGNRLTRLFSFYPYKTNSFCRAGKSLIDATSNEFPLSRFVHLERISLAAAAVVAVTGGMNNHRQGRERERGFNRAQEQCIRT